MLGDVPLGAVHGGRDRHDPGVATIDQALAELAVAGATAADPQTQQWMLLPGHRHPLLEAVDLHGAHDFRHTFSTWLEDAGIPARVIDELMGHQASGRSGRHQASAIGAHYRHTTPEMAPASRCGRGALSSSCDRGGRPRQQPW